jgi:hypothetical protein
VVRTSGQKHLLRWKISKLIENYSILYLTNNTNDPNSGSPTDTKISSNLSIDSNKNSSPTDDDDANSKFNE